MTTESTTDIAPATPVAELAELIENEMHEGCNCPTCMERTAKTIAEHIGERFEIRRRP